MAGSTEGRSEGDAAQQEGHTGCQREFGHAEVQRQEYLDRRKAEEGSRTADCTGKDAADKQGRPAVLRLDDRAETEQLRQHQYLDGATGNRIQGLLVELGGIMRADRHGRSEEHTSELQSLMRNSYAVFCLKKKMKNRISITHNM